MSKLLVAAYAVFISLLILGMALWPSSLEERHAREMRAAHAYGPAELWGCLHASSSAPGGFALDVTGPAGGAMATGGGGVAHSPATNGPETPGAPDVAGGSAAMEVVHTYSLRAPSSIPLRRHINHMMDLTGRFDTATQGEPSFDVQTATMMSAGCTGA